MEHELLAVVDAFTDKPFAGNPAGVCLLNEPRDDHWMQKMAAEMMYAETAFPIKRGDHEYDLRWFTPAVEISLCGHATLATSHFLFSEGFEDTSKPITYHTKSGDLVATAEDGGLIRLDFPSNPTEQVTVPSQALPALSVQVRFASKASGEFLVLEIDDEDDVRRLKPDMNLIAELSPHGVIATAKGKDKYDFVSRFFAPHLGIPEDPVTGAAHCVLTPYWSQKLGKTEMFAYQASPRGGELTVRHKGNRVHLIGKAVTVTVGDVRV